tara:strand:- start:11420 stop:12523 length:1104 start_codon:yes stop_codon:yes gene_type:complete
MTKFLCFLLLLSSQIGVSQNLVKNPSFEDFDKCPWTLSMFHNNVNYWSCPNHSSTDFFRACGNVKETNDNYNGVQTPFLGDAYAGIYCYADDDYREYVQGELQRKLLANETYVVHFYISLAEKSSFSIKNLAVLFTGERIGASTQRASVLNSPKGSNQKFGNLSKKFINPETLKIRNRVLQNDTLIPFYNDTKQWMQVSFTYQALGFEQFLTIGNFESNTETHLNQEKSEFEHAFAYYYIDAISVEAIKTSYKTDTIYTFKNVLFEFDKSVLLKESVEELDKLFNYLKRNNLKVEIYGHTDAIGLQTHNDKLSEERAKAVSDYLIKSGLEASRIIWFGYGSSKPKAENNSEENRALNRRVEFKLVNL